MTRYLDATISALVYDLGEIYSGPPTGTAVNYNDIVRFVMDQLNRMPSFLGFAVRAVTMFFGAVRLPVEFSFFHQRDPLRRRSQIESWMRSKILPCQEFIKLYASLTVLALNSRPACAVL
jgi:hypothetical protein